MAEEGSWLRCPTATSTSSAPFTFRLPGLVLASLLSFENGERERFLRLAGAISWGLVGGEDEVATGVSARREA